jgi:hypothetical protein
MHANSVEEAVDQVAGALARFNKENSFYRRLFSKTEVKAAWENLREHCQQLSQWIEHGRGVTVEMKPELTKTLFAAEKVLLDNEQYSPRKLYRKK